MVGSIANAYGVDPFTGLPDVYEFANLQDTLNALLQFSGEEASSQGRYATETSDRNFNNIGTRLSAIRRGVRASSGLAFNMNGTDLMGRTDSSLAQSNAPLIGGAAGDSGGDLGWGWFGSVDYGFGDRDGTVNEDEFEYDSIGFTIGLDYVFDNDWVLGGTFAWDDTEIDFDGSNLAIPQNSGGGLDSDGYTLSGFAMYYGPVYFTTILSVSDWDYDMDREARFTATSGSVVNRQFEGSTEGKQISGEFSVGKIFGEGATTFDVYVAGSFQFLEIDGFDETGLPATGGGANGLALRFSEQDIDSRQAVLGGVVRHNLNTDMGVITPYLGLEWRTEFEDDARIVDNRYVFAPSGSNPQGFRTITDEQDDNYGEVTLGISAQMQNSLFLFLQWDAAVGLEDTSANIISLGIRGVF